MEGGFEASSTLCTETEQLSTLDHRQSQALSMEDMPSPRILDPVLLPFRESPPRKFNELCSSPARDPNPVSYDSRALSRPLQTPVSSRTFASPFKRFVKALSPLIKEKYQAQRKKARIPPTLNLKELEEMNER